MRDERGDETDKREEMKECAEHPETYSWLNYENGGNDRHRRSTNSPKLCSQDF